MKRRMQKNHSRSRATRQSAAFAAACAQRRAATLAEVLVSIMILSIGIISLATLFPISILRSLQATQLTNATILRYNAETAVEMNSLLVYDPDHNTNSMEHDGTEYLVDPLGWARSNGLDDVGGLERFPGLAKFDPVNGSVTQAVAEANAIAAVTLPDSWVSIYEGIPASIAGDRMSITLDASDIADEIVSVSQIADMLTSNVSVRAVVFSQDGRSSQVRPVATATGSTITWSTALPASYSTASRIRLESAELRYTWLLTVRRGDAMNAGVADVDVVVFFRRPDPPAGETGYAANFRSGVQEVNVSYSGEGPDLKKGGFILDASNAIWYRIQSIDKTPGSAKLQLDRPANATGTTAVVMEGVVEVYPIGSKLNTAP